MNQNEALDMKDNQRVCPISLCAWIMTRQDGYYFCPVHGFFDEDDL